MTKIKLYLSVLPKLSPIMGKKKKTKDFDAEFRYGHDTFADFHGIDVVRNQTNDFCVKARLVPTTPGHHPILLTPPLSVNLYGDIKISRIKQLMIEHGLKIAYSSIDKLPDLEEL
jgi:hypothetical protein